MHHPSLVQDLARARQADTARRVEGIHHRSQALLHRSARPPSPSRLRMATARTLAATAQRLVPGENLEDLRHA